jgi:hypothetical protein
VRCIIRKINTIDGNANSAAPLMKAMIEQTKKAYLMKYRIEIPDAKLNVVKTKYQLKL